VSAQAESEKPEAELKPGIDLLGPVDELFIDTYDRYEPTNDPSSDNCFISTVSICASSDCSCFQDLANTKDILKIIAMYPKLICFRVMMPQHTSSPL
jgi:RAB protein geranylgeranyltransferase component A